MAEPRVKYDNSRRTRARSGEPASGARRGPRGCCVSEGFAGMRLAEVAEAAGVSVETVYKQFRNKGGLLKAAYDVRLAGDDEPVPLIERPAYRAMVDEPDPAGKVRHYAALGRQISERTGPLAVRVLECRGAHPEVEEFARTIEAERLFGATTFVAALEDAGALRPGLDAGPRARRAVAADLARGLGRTGAAPGLDQRRLRGVAGRRRVSGAARDPARTG